MNALLTTNQPLTMSSREIAELTGKKLHHVHRDIGAMLGQLGHDPDVDHLVERDGRGYIHTYRLPKDLTITLVSGYSVPLRHRIVTRWMELEEGQRAELIICGTAIRQDSEGRYCLNDLHKAAGGAKAHQPSNFTRRVETYALVAEIANSSDVRNYEPVKQGAGRSGGTYVCEDLVYAYAMWISPAFNLKVIRAYDTLQTQGVAVAEFHQCN